MSSILNSELIQAAAASQPPLSCEPVDVREFGAGVTAYVAQLTAHERDERISLPYEAYREKNKQKGHAGIKAFIAAGCLCKSQAKDFEAKTEEQIVALAEVLNSLSGDKANAMVRIADKAAQINAMTTDEKETIEKN